MQGAEILFYPTAIGWHPREKAEYGKAQHESWELIQRSHAVANGCYVCAPNRIGHELVRGADGKPVSDDGIEFWGQSFVAAPDGAGGDRAPASTTKRCWSCRLRPGRASSSAARTGRSCAIGASTRTAT